MAKRKLEKERELFMSKSLPGFPGDNQGSIDNENESESDEDSDGSEEKGIIIRCGIVRFVCIFFVLRQKYSQ